MCISFVLHVWINDVVDTRIDLVLKTQLQRMTVESNGRVIGVQESMNEKVKREDWIWLPCHETSGDRNPPFNGRNKNAFDTAEL